MERTTAEKARLHKRDGEKENADSDNVRAFDSLCRPQSGLSPMVLLLVRK